MTASDHAQQRSQRFPLPGRGRPQMESRHPRDVRKLSLFRTRRERVAERCYVQWVSAPERTKLLRLSGTRGRACAGPGAVPHADRLARVALSDEPWQIL